MFLALDFALFSLLETSCSFMYTLFIGIGNIHFIFMCRLWFVLDSECVSDPCCFESSFAWVILVSFCMLIFSVLGRKDWLFVSLSVSKKSFSFLSILLYSKDC